MALPRIPFNPVAKSPEQEAREFIAINNLPYKVESLYYKDKKVPPVPSMYVGMIKPYKGTIRGYTIYRIDVINGSSLYRAVDMGRNLRLGRRFMWGTVYDVLKFTFTNSPLIGDYWELGDCILGAMMESPTDQDVFSKAMDDFAAHTYKKQVGKKHKYNF